MSAQYSHTHCLYGYKDNALHSFFYKRHASEGCNSVFADEYSAEIR